MYTGVAAKGTNLLQSLGLMGIRIPKVQLSADFRAVAREAVPAVFSLLRSLVPNDLLVNRVASRA